MLNERQLVWRCRRGVRELDVLFTEFLNHEYAALSAEQQLAFQALLEVQDPTIMDWLFGRSASEPVFAETIGLLQMFSQRMKRT